MLKSKIQQFIRSIGLEIRSYSPSTSERARLFELINRHKTDLILDIGANEGQYVRFLRNYGYRGQIVSFEPLSSAYAVLEGLSANDSNWALAPRAALSNADGEVTLNIAGNSQSSSVLPMLESHEKAAPDAVYVGTEQAKAYRLDSIPLPISLDNYQSIFAKIDVQGLEKLVIEGATSLLPRIKGMQIELSLVELYENEPLYIEMIQWMEGHGYELFSMLPNFVDPNSARLMQMDGIFFRPE